MYSAPSDEVNGLTCTSYKINVRLIPVASTVSLEIFVVKILSWSIEATKIKITKLKRMRMLQCGKGSFLRIYFIFWIYGIHIMYVHVYCVG